jgi:hypothetical protein
MYSKQKLGSRLLAIARRSSMLCARVTSRPE